MESAFSLDGIITIVVGLGAITLGVGIIWLIFRVHKSRTQLRLARAEAYSRLLEKFSSTKEFSDFLQTEQGRQFVEDPLPAPKSGLTRILRLVQTGVIIFAIGIAFFLNAYRLRDVPDPNYYHQAMDSRFWGIFGVTIGVGLLVTAALSYVIAKRWHLYNGNGQNR
jgi:hypothetical protein